MISLTEEDLWALIDRLDREACASGISPSARSIKVVMAACQKLGIQFSLGGPKNLDIERLFGMHSALYRTVDLGMGNIFSGLATHLDLFFRVEFPIIFGTVQLDILKLVDITDNQYKRMLEKKEDRNAFHSHIVDVWDIGATLSNLDPRPIGNELANGMFRKSALHMEAATAATVNLFKYEGAIQSALLCAELAIKAAYSMITGCDEDHLKDQVGHKLLRALPVISQDTRFNIKNLQERIDILPDFVKSRYDARKWSRLETGKIAIAAQFLLAEVSRAHLGQSFSSQLDFL